MVLYGISFGLPCLCVIAGFAIFSQVTNDDWDSYFIMPRLRRRRVDKGDMDLFSLASDGSNNEHDSVNLAVHLNNAPMSSG